MNTIFEKIYVLHLLSDKNKDNAIKRKFEYLDLQYEYVYSLPLLDLFEANNSQHINVSNDLYEIYKNTRSLSCAFGHYMCVYQAYQLGYNNALIFEDDIIINKDKELVYEYLNNVPKDADIIRYGYMEWDGYNTERFDNTNELFYKDNENNDYRYYGVQCYGLMNRKSMKIYLDSCNKRFTGNEDVEDIFRNNKYSLNIYYATKPIFLDYLGYLKYDDYHFPYSDNLLNKYEFIE